MKFRTLICLSLFAMVATVIISCKSKNGNSLEISHYKKVYKQAMVYGDYFAATNAMYHLLADDTANAISYKDTLANLYYTRGQYVQTIALCKEVLTKQPDDIKIMALIAAADQNVNNLNESLEYYQKLYTKTHNLFQLYQIATNQYNLGRVNECNQTLDRIINDTSSLHQGIQLTVGQRQQQAVPYKAAALNIRGVIAKGLKQNDAAKKAFEDALTIDPNFVLAKGNLSDMSKNK